MSFVEYQDETWSETAWSLYHVLTAKAGAASWTEPELGRAINEPDEDVVCGGLNELFLSGHIRPAFPSAGWRRS